MTNPPMTSLGAKIRSHLKEHRPTLVAQLPPHQLDQMSATLQEMADVAYRPGEDQRPGARPSAGARSGRVGVPGRGGRVLSEILGESVPPR